MKRVRATFFASILLFLAAVSAQSLAQMPEPKPAPELKKLNYFVGTWTTEADMKPSQFGPGGKFTSTDENRWLGEFYVILNSDFKSSTGNGTELAVLDYDPNEKVYTYEGFNSMGEHEASKGKLEGETWTFTSDEKMGDHPVKGRFTMKVVSPTAYNFKFEVSPDGNNWSAIMDGKATKSK